MHGIILKIMKQSVWLIELITRGTLHNTNQIIPEWFYTVTEALAQVLKYDTTPMNMLSDIINDSDVSTLNAAVRGIDFSTFTYLASIF